MQIGPDVWVPCKGQNDIQIFPPKFPANPGESWGFRSAGLTSVIGHVHCSRMLSRNKSSEAPQEASPASCPTFQLPAIPLSRGKAEPGGPGLPLVVPFASTYNAGIGTQLEEGVKKTIYFMQKAYLA